MAETKDKKETQSFSAARCREPVIYSVSLLTDDDIYLFNEGSHFCLFEKLGLTP